MILFLRKRNSFMESRNLILAIILSVGVLFIWSFFFEAPKQEIPNEEIQSSDMSEVGSNELAIESIDEEPPINGESLSRIRSS